jgi:hypothetical protein
VRLFRVKADDGVYKVVEYVEAVDAILAIHLVLDNQPGWSTSDITSVKAVSDGVLSGNDE